VKRAIAQLAAAEGRLLSIRDKLFGHALATREAAPRHKGTGGTRKWMIWLPAGNLQDAPDLGLQNRRFQGVPFRFTK
jgi:hypothetical protein